MICSKGLAKRGETGAASKSAERERPAKRIFFLKATNNLWNVISQIVFQRGKVSLEMEKPVQTLSKYSRMK